MGGAVSGLVDSIGGAVSDAGSFLDDAAHQAAPIVGAYYGIPPSVTNAALNMGSSSGGGQSLASSYLPTNGYQPYGATPTGYGGSQQPINIYNQQPQAQQDQQGMFAQLLPFLMQAGGGALQQSVNKDAAQQQADALRQAGQQASTASQFRPVGTTTRFGSSNFQVDPTTGQLVSAGYNVSPEMKAYQDRLTGLASQGLAGAEGAQAQYAPLQQGAQSMFGLGNQYLQSQQGQPLTTIGQQYLNASPEEARQRYMDQQNALVAGGNEQTLAGIRNNLFQTGRQGLATGATTAGNMAATNPEMAAYYNALAKQQAGFAAGAETAAQNQQKLGSDLYSTGTKLTQQGQGFGADLFGTGASNLGTYYSGQNAALAPYTGAMTGLGNIETAAQQPFKMSTDLASQFQNANQQGAYYNLNAQNAAANAMLRANQVNPYADILTALGKTPTATSAVGGAVGGLLGGLFGGNTAQAGQTAASGGGNILGGLGGLGSIFPSNSYDPGFFGSSGGTNVYNPNAFDFNGTSGGVSNFTDAFDLGSVDFSSWM